MNTFLNISEAASLSLHSAVLLAAQPQERLSTKELAAELKASEAHLAKIMQRLVSVGLMESRRGPKGGFALTDKGRNATLLDFFQAIHYSPTGHACLFKQQPCAGPCILGDLISQVEQIVIKRL